MPDLVPLQQAAGEFGLNPATLHPYIEAGKQRWQQRGCKLVPVAATRFRSLPYEIGL